MDHKDMMINSLTGLLQDGETLMHPIYGILNQGNHSYYGYFGFTEAALLIALISGKHITHTIRIPLDIRSVKIKQTLLLRQYVIDISFNEGAPCRITASPKVLLIDSQKENLPLFLAFLTAKSSQPEPPSAQEMSGKKIRWQYFNSFIYLLLSVQPMPFIMIVVTGLKEGNLDIPGLIEALPTVLAMWGVCFLPAVILSLLNRFFFGKIVCVANEDGLHLENDHIAWEDIQEVTYIPDMPSRFRLGHSYARITVKRPAQEAFDIEIGHFPFYGLRTMKKLCPHLDIRVKKGIIVFFALMPALVALIIGIIA